MPEPRLLCFHDADLAARWQAALDAAGLPAQCIAFDKPFKDERGFWQPPRWKWYDYTCPDGRVKHFYLIDGFWFRNNVRIDYSEGGNHMAYEEIPPDCEYLEAENAEVQTDTRIVGEHHESPEDLAMSDDPACVYEEAHGLATAEERDERDRYRDPRVLADPSRRAEGSQASGDDRMSLLAEVIASRRGERRA